jgi:hypothetical protein
MTLRPLRSTRSDAPRTLSPVSFLCRMHAQVDAKPLHNRSADCLWGSASNTSWPCSNSRPRRHCHSLSGLTASAACSCSLCTLPRETLWSAHQNRDWQTRFAPSMNSEPDCLSHNLTRSRRLLQMTSIRASPQLLLVFAALFNLSFPNMASQEHVNEKSRKSVPKMEFCCLQLHKNVIYTLHYSN